MILRDLVTRLTFRADTTPLKTIDQSISGMVSGVRTLTTAIVSGLAMRAGGSLEQLKEQFKTLYGQGAKPFIDEMNKLQNETGGLFTPRELIQAGIGARQAGMNGLEAAEALHMASRLLVASGGDIGVAMGKLVQGLQTGGLADTFRELGLLTPVVADVINSFESQMSEAGGVLGPEAVRQFNRRLLAAFQDPAHKKQFDDVFIKYLTTDAAAIQRAQANLATTWDELSVQLLKGVAPALNSVNKGLRALNENLKEFGGVEGSIKEVSDAVGALFSNELSAKQVAGLTTGGLLMFIVTKNPLWLGLAGAALGEGAFNLGVEARKMVDDVLHGGPPGSPERMLRQKEQETYVDPLEKELERGSRKGAPSIQQRTEELKNRLGFNQNGDINIHINAGPATLAEALAMGSDALKREVNRLVVSQLDGLEA